MTRPRRKDTNRYSNSDSNELRSIFEFDFLSVRTRDAQGRITDYEDLPASLTDYERNLIFQSDSGSPLLRPWTWKR
jgi:hypothetical protein